MRVGVDLVIGKQGSLPLVAEAGGPMARRTFDVIDICDYAERQVMQSGAAPAGGASCPAGLWLPEHAA